MTAFAACLFTLAAVASAWCLAATVRKFGPQAAQLRVQLAACPDALAVEWKMVERVKLSVLGDLRKMPDRRPAERITIDRTGLEWPRVSAALDLAA